MDIREKIEFALLNLLEGFESFRAYRINLARRLIRYEVASEEDTEGLSHLYKDIPNKPSSSLSSSMKRMEKRKGSGYILKAFVGEQVLGAVFLIFIPEEEFSPYSSGWWIFSLLVEERYRRLGIGENLLLRAVQKAKTLGATEVNLIVAADNEAANKLYGKMGFERNSNPKVEEFMREELRHGKSSRVFLTIKLDKSP